MGKLRTRVVLCSYEVTEQECKPREFDAKTQDLDHLATFPVMAARSSSQEEEDQGDACGKLLESPGHIQTLWPWLSFHSLPGAWGEGLVLRCPL